MNGLVATSWYVWNVASKRVDLTTLHAPLPVPLINVSAVAEITGLGASVTLRQTFVHPFRPFPTSGAPASAPPADEHVLECVYSFPLSELVSVTHFVAELGGRRVDGVLREREIARATYEHAKAVGQRAALLETATTQCNVFTCSVGRLAPGETCTIEITYVAPLDMQSTSCTRFAMPLRVAPKYNSTWWQVPPARTTHYVLHPWLRRLVVAVPVVLGANGNVISAADDDAIDPSLAESLFAFPSLPGSRRAPSRYAWLKRPNTFVFPPSPTGSPSSSTTTTTRVTPTLSLFALRATICTGTALQSVSSVHHAMSSVPVDAHTMNVELRARLDDDSNTHVVLEIRHEPSSAYAVLEVSNSFGVSTPSPSSSPPSPSPPSLSAYTGAFQIAIPHRELSVLEQTELPCELVFLLDRSGSMAGSSIESLRRAMQLLLRSLPTTCTFNIFSFGSSYASLFRTSAAYSDATLAQASELVAKMQADMGGTEIEAPLHAVLGGSTAAPSRPRQVFVLTDGQVSGYDRMADFVRKHAGLTRLFTIGIGSGVDQNMCRTLARAGRGDVAFVAHESIAEITETVMRLLKRSLQPVLTGVRVDWGPFDKPSVHSARFSSDVDATTATTATSAVASGSGGSGGSGDRVGGGAFRAPSATSVAAQLGFMRVTPPVQASGASKPIFVRGAFQQCPETVPPLFPTSSGCSFVYALNATLPDAIVEQIAAYVERCRLRRQSVGSSQSATPDEPFELQVPDGVTADFAIEYRCYDPNRGYAVQRVPLCMATHVVQSDVIHRLAARARIEEIDEVLVNEDRTRVDDAVREMALTYGIASRLTSFVAVEPMQPSQSRAPELVLQQQQQLQQDSESCRRSSVRSLGASSQTYVGSLQMDDDLMCKSAVLGDGGMSAFYHQKKKISYISSSSKSQPGFFNRMVNSVQKVFSSPAPQAHQQAVDGSASRSDAAKGARSRGSAAAPAAPSNAAPSNAAFACPPSGAASALMTRSASLARPAAAPAPPAPPAASAPSVSATARTASRDDSPIEEEANLGGDDFDVDVSEDEFGACFGGDSAPSSTLPRRPGTGRPGPGAYQQPSAQQQLSAPPFDVLVQEQQSNGSWSLDSATLVAVVHKLTASSAVELAVRTWMASHSIDAVGAGTLLAVLLFHVYFASRLVQAELALAKAQRFLQRTFGWEQAKQDELRAQLRSLLP